MMTGNGTRPVAAVFVRIWPVLLVVITLLPLWLFRYVPATDYPLHLSMGRVIVDLITDNSLSAAHYQFNPQPIPYWFTYLLLSPLIVIFGADIAGSILLTGIGVGFFLAIWRIIRLLDLHALCFVPSVFLFYGATFFWGFLTSLIAVPFILWGGVFLLRYGNRSSRTDIAMAVACGCIVSASSMLMIVPWVYIVLAWVLVDWRRNWRAGLIVTAASSLPILSWFVASLLSVVGDQSTGISAVYVKFSGLYGLIIGINQQLGIFGQGLGYIAAWAMLLLVAINIAIGFPWNSGSMASTASDWARQNRFAGGVLLFSLLAYAFLPLGIWFGDDVAWGINFRYITFIGIALILLGPKSHRLHMEERIPRGIAVLMSASVVAYWVALFSFWSAFDTSMRDIETAFDSMEPGRRVVIVREAERFMGSWPPVGLHVPSYYVARKGGMSSDVFSGGHMPIKIIGVFDSELLDYSSLRIGEFHYMLVQVNGNIPESAAPADGILVVKTASWRLYKKA